MVALIDSDEIFIKGIQTLFVEQQIPLHKVISNYEIPENFYRNCNVLICDPYKSQKFGTQDIRKALDNNNNLRILVITSISHKHLVDDVIQMGVNAVLFKCCKTQEFVSAYLKAIKGECHYCSSIYDRTNDLKISKIQELTEREQEIVRLICEGSTTQEIASVLNRSTHTINSHRKNILKKLGVKTPLELLKIISE